MSQVALVQNRASTGNLTRAADPAPASVRLIDCTTLDALTPDLHAAHTAGAEVVLVDGGDGTVREVLSRLPEIWGTALPRVGILPRGNTNLIAREVGGLPSPGAVTEALRRIEAGAPLTERRRAMLRLDFPEPGRPAIRGFIVGWGAYATGTRVAREEITARGSRQVTRTVLSMFRRTMFGGERAALRKGIAASITIDGAPAPGTRRFVGVATTLQGSLVAGLNPFWGDGSGPIRWLDILAPVTRLAQATPYLVRGKPAGWMAEAGYTSGCADRIELSLKSPFVMDGEIFLNSGPGSDPNSDHRPLRLSASEEITFIAL